MSQFNDFFNKNNGQPVEVEDPSNLDQCFDLAFAWCDFIGVPREAIRHLYAYEIYAKPTDDTVKYFWLVPNTPNGIPSEGDLVIFNQDVGAAGHVSIATGSGNINSFESFDQNWGGVKYARLVNHKYTSVSGWLTRKVEVSPSDPVIIQHADNWMALLERYNFSDNKDLVFAEIDKLPTLEEAIITKDKELAANVNTATQLETQAKELSEQLKVAKEEYQNSQEEHQKTMDTYDQEIKKLQGDVVTLQKASNLPTLTGWKKFLYSRLVWFIKTF